MATKITADNLAPALATAITQGGGPKISSIAITDSSYNTLDDTAVSTSGGHIKILGSGFSNGCQVTVGTTLASSVAFISSSELRVQVSAGAAGSHPVYVTNPDGGTATRINGLTYSAFPAWLTGSPLTSVIGNQVFNILVSANSDSNITYTLAPGSSLPSGANIFANGLITGNVSVEDSTTFNFVLIATDQENQNTNSSFSLAVLNFVPFAFANISPALGGKTTWNPLTDGNLIFTSAGEYTVVVNNYVGPTSNSYVVKLWGAGGKSASSSVDGWGSGAAGGAGIGTVTFVKNGTYIFRIGAAGVNGPAPPTAYGAGGGGGSAGFGTAGGGGGYTGIFLSSVTQANAILMAGGAGGGASSRPDGRGGRPGAAGGGLQGWSGDGLIAPSGTQSSGSPFNTGSSGGGGGGGGGGGYFGGTGGSAHGDGGFGGGGGSGYANVIYVSSANLSTGLGLTAGNSSDPDRPTNAGGSGPAGQTAYPGAIVIKAP